MRQIFGPLVSPFFLFAILLTLVGLINLNSATQTFQSVEFSGYFKSQVLYHGVGLGILLVVCQLRHRILYQLAFPVYVFSLALLMTVLILGLEVHGSQSWFEFAGLRFQPSELAKLGFVFYLAKHFSLEDSQKTLGFRDLIKPLIIGGLPMLLVMLQGDLGSSLFFGLILASLLLIHGVRWQILVMGLVSAIVVIVLAYNFMLQPYQKKRIVSFMDPELDPRGSGYHLVQSKIAVGSGGLLGSGYRKGKSHKLKFLPERHTDFIFPVLAEEWGLLGSTVTLGLFMLLFLSGAHIIWKSGNRFEFFVTTGLTTLFFWQFFINIGGVLGLIPLTGVPMPFLSYGGSSSVSLWLGVGVMLAISYEHGGRSARA